MSIRVAGQPHEIPAALQVPASGLDAEAAHLPQANVRVCSHPRHAGSSSPSKCNTNTHWLSQELEIVKTIHDVKATCKKASTPLNNLGKRQYAERSSAEPYG